MASSKKFILLEGMNSLIGLDVVQLPSTSEKKPMLAIKDKKGFLPLVLCLLYKWCGGY